MNKSYISKIIAVVLTALVLPFSAVALDFAGTPDITFNEDTTHSTLDLDTYISNSVGTVIYDYSGNDNIAVSIDANGVVTFTPEANWNGNEQITFEVTDDIETKQEVVSVTVTAVNDAPTLTLPEKLNAVEGEAFSHQVVASDVEGALTYTADAGNWDTFTMSAAGLITFTPENADVGLHQASVTVKDTDNVEVIKNVVIVVGEPADDNSLIVDNFDVTDKTGDDAELLPGDEIKVEFDVSNEITTDMNDVRVRVWIEDDAGERISDRIDTEKFNVEGKTTETKDVTLKVPVDAKDGKHYVVFEATGQDDDGNDVYDLTFESIDVERNAHNLLIESVTFNPEMPICGSSVEIAVKVANIGTSDEDDAYVTIKNTKLGIDYKSDVFEVQDSGSDADYTVRAVVDIPKSAGEDLYPLDVKVTFNEGDTISKIVDMAASCGAASDDVALNTASTFADVAAGQTVKFVVEVENNGATAADFTLSATNVQDWAIVTIEPGDVSVDAGKSIPVNVYITPKTTAALGAHTATLSVESGGEVVATKDFTITVESKTPTVTGFVTGLNVGGSDSTTFLLILVGIVLVAGFAFISRGRNAKGNVSVYNDDNETKKRR